jgi:hypothetical protein
MRYASVKFNVDEDDNSPNVDLVANSENIQPGMVGVFTSGILMRFFHFFCLTFFNFFVYFCSQYRYKHCPITF